MMKQVFVASLLVLLSPFVLRSKDRFGHGSSDAIAVSFVELIAGGDAWHAKSVKTYGFISTREGDFVVLELDIGRTMHYDPYTSILLDLKTLEDHGFSSQGTLRSGEFVLVEGRFEMAYRNNHAVGRIIKVNYIVFPERSGVVTEIK